MLSCVVGHYGNDRQGDAVSADVREEIIQPIADNVATTITSSLDTISEDGHVMPAPPPPTSTVTTPVLVLVISTVAYVRWCMIGVLT